MFKQFINSQSEARGLVKDIEKSVNKFIKEHGEHRSCAYRSLYFNVTDYQLFLRKEAKISENSWSLYWKGAKCLSNNQIDQ